MRQFLNIINNAYEPILAESATRQDTITVNSVTVRITYDASTSELKTLIENSRQKRLRGFIRDDTVVFWDAFAAVHFEVTRALKWTFDPDNCLELDIEDGHVVIEMPFYDITNPVVDTLIRSSDVMFDVDGEIVTGEQILSGDVCLSGDV